MRTWTLAVSIFAHAAVVVAIFVAPIFATADLPDPRRPLTFESITPIVTPTIPVPLRSQPTQPAAAQSIPLIEPTQLPPDTPPAVPDIPPDHLVAPGGTGVPPTLFAPLGDPVVAPPQAPARKDPVRVGGVIRPPTRVVYVAPVYPPLALAARKEGTVILQAVIDEHGSVREVQVLRGDQLLNDAAMLAVTKWRFTPTELNGTTVPVVMTVTVTFTLQK
jgi:periplasmic protein TonB